MKKWNKSENPSFSRWRQKSWWSSIFYHSVTNQIYFELKIFIQGYHNSIKAKRVRATCKIKLKYKYKKQNIYRYNTIKDIKTES